MAHTGFFAPHPESHYPDSELRLPNEIDLPLITLGGTVDSAFQQALADAFDPFGNLDTNPNVIGVGHSVKDFDYPYYPVLRYHTDGATEGWEYRRPWAYPNLSPVQVTNSSDTLRVTPTETYDPAKSFSEGPDAPFKPLSAGPYPLGTQPDVFFRLDAPVDSQVRLAYEGAQTPWETDMLNMTQLAHRDLRFSPLGDPIPFSCHLIAQLANDTGYSTQFNLDSDRGFAYLTWDWIRNDKSVPLAHGVLGLTYATPKVPPEGAPGWAQQNPLLLTYKDPPTVPKPPPR
jgi:hypothetical protein